MWDNQLKSLIARVISCAIVVEENSFGRIISAVTWSHSLCLKSQPRCCRLWESWASADTLAKAWRSHKGWERPKLGRKGQMATHASLHTQNVPIRTVSKSLCMWELNDYGHGWYNLWALSIKHKHNKFVCKSRVKPRLHKIKPSVQQGKFMCEWIYERFMHKFILLMFHMC